MVVAGAVNVLLGGVLDGLSEGVRSRCDRGRILREPLRLGKALERHLGSSILEVTLLK